ncbi:MAG: hypothetical protein AVDCRST_MAG64-517, partial [uncultured Phycisphaerae bacterium]
PDRRPHHGRGGARLRPGRGHSDDDRLGRRVGRRAAGRGEGRAALQRVRVDGRARPLHRHAQAAREAADPRARRRPQVVGGRHACGRRVGHLLGEDEPVRRRTDRAVPEGAVPAQPARPEGGGERAVRAVHGRRADEHRAADRRVHRADAGQHPRADAVGHHRVRHDSQRRPSAAAPGDRDEAAQAGRRFRRGRRPARQAPSPRLARGVDVPSGDRGDAPRARHPRPAGV